MEDISPFIRNSGVCKYILQSCFKTMEKGTKKTTSKETHFYKLQFN